MKDDNYIAIGGWMVNQLHLTGNELLVYAIIYGFSQDGESWFKGSKKYIAESAGISSRTVVGVLKKLTDKGLIKKKEVNTNGVIFNDYAVTSQGMKNFHGGGEESSSGGCKNFMGGGEESSPHKNNYILQEHISNNISNREIYKEIVDYLNETAGTHYKATSEKTQRLINARLNEGFTVEDFKTVIYKKCAEWLPDEHMQQYCRPETLFGTKFESYLNQRTDIRQKKGEDLAF